MGEEGLRTMLDVALNVDIKKLDFLQLYNLISTVFQLRGDTEPSTHCNLINVHYESECYVGGNL